MWENVDFFVVVGVEFRETFYTLCKTFGDRLFNDKVVNVMCVVVIMFVFVVKVYVEFVFVWDVCEVVGDLMLLLVDKFGDINFRFRESIREALYVFVSDVLGGVNILVNVFCKLV